MMPIMIPFMDIVKKDEDFPGYYTFAECKTGKILRDSKVVILKLGRF